MRPDLGESKIDCFSFRQLRLFETVGRVSSVRRGSEECNLSQPAVTQALAKLESQIGETLLKRQPNGSHLTEAGEILHKRVVRMFARIEEALLDLGVVTASARQAVNRLTRVQALSLLAIIEHENLDKAAGALGTTRASLQRTARNLESHLRKPLFYRSAGGPVVTPDGLALGRGLKLALLEVRWGLQEVRAMHSSGERRITIGALPFGGSVLLASVLDRFIASYPNTEVRIINEGATEMMKRLRTGDVDFVIGLVQETIAQDVVNESFASTPYSVVARCGHPLHKRRNVTIQDLLAQEWVVATPGASRRACFDRIFSRGPRPTATIETCALQIIRRLLARSDRLTLMTSYELLHEDQALAAITFGPIEPAPHIGVTTRAGWLPTQTHLDFIHLLRTHMAQDATIAATIGISAISQTEIAEPAARQMA